MVKVTYYYLFFFSTGIQFYPLEDDMAVLLLKVTVALENFLYS